MALFLAAEVPCVTSAIESSAYSLRFAGDAITERGIARTVWRELTFGRDRYLFRRSTVGNLFPAHGASRYTAQAVTPKRRPTRFVRRFTRSSSRSCTNGRSR